MRGLWDKYNSFFNLVFTGEGHHLVDAVQRVGLDVVPDVDPAGENLRDLVEVARGLLDGDDPGNAGKFEDPLRSEILSRPTGNVVEDDR